MKLTALFQMVLKMIGLFMVIIYGIDLIILLTLYGQNWQGEIAIIVLNSLEFLIGLLLLGFSKSIVHVFKLDRGITEEAVNLPKLSLVKFFEMSLVLLGIVMIWWSLPTAVYQLIGAFKLSLSAHDDLEGLLPLFIPNQFNNQVFWRMIGELILGVLIIQRRKWFVEKLVGHSPEA